MWPFRRKKVDEKKDLSLLEDSYFLARLRNLLPSMREALQAQRLWIWVDKDDIITIHIELGDILTSDLSSIQHHTNYVLDTLDLRKYNPKIEVEQGWRSPEISIDINKLFRIKIKK